LDNLLSLAELADAWIGHNVLRFDKQMLEAWAAREGRTIPSKLWIDTMTDLPGVEGKKLTYLAADHGLINPFPHSALADCQTVVKIVENYNIEEVVKRASSTVVILQAHHDRNENEKAKGAKFRWHPDRKIWWKAVKDIDMQEFTKTLPFDVSVRADLTRDDLET